MSSLQPHRTVWRPRPQRSGLCRRSGDSLRSLAATVIHSAVPCALCHHAQPIIRSVRAAGATWEAGINEKFVNMTYGQVRRLYERFGPGRAVWHTALAPAPPLLDPSHWTRRSAV